MKKLLPLLALLSIAMVNAGCASLSVPPPLPVVARCPVLPAPDPSLMVRQQPTFSQRLPGTLLGSPTKPTQP